MRLAAPALSALLALAGCQAMAYQAAARSLLIPPPPMDHGLDAQVLPSGLRLAVFQVPGQRDVTVSLAMGAGAADEPAGKAGLAQVALIAALQAPRGRGGASLQEELYAAGALLGGGVEADETTLAVRCRPAYQGAVLAALSELLDDPAAGLQEEVILRGRQAVASRLEREVDTAAAATREVKRLALAGTAFGRPAPTPEGVRSLTLDDVRAFLRASMAPHRSTLWLSTGQDAEREAARVVGALRGRALGDAAHPVAPEPGFSSEPPPARQPTREVALTGGAKPRLLLAWRAPGIRFGPAADRAGGELRQILGWRAARPDLTQKVSFVGVSLESLDRASVLVIEVGLERLEDAEPVRQALVEASRRTGASWTWPAPAVEALLRRRLRMEREEGLEYGWVGPVGRLVRAVGSADVPAWLDLNEASQFGPAARAWLDAWIAPGPSVVATVTAAPEAAPVGGHQPLSGDATPPRVEGQAAWPVAQSPVAAAVPGADELERLLEPAGLEAARRERLPNGIELLVLRRPAAPFAFVELRLPGGAVRVSEGLAARQALAGARDGLQAGGCGLAPQAKAYADGVVLQLGGSRAWLPALIEAMACWGQPLSAGRLRMPTPDEAMPWQAYEAALTGGPLPERSGGARWGEAYLRRLQQTEGAVVVVAGDVDPAPALDLLRKAFGRLPRRGPGSADPTSAPPRWPTARRVIIEDVPGARQASATLFLRLPDDLAEPSARRWTFTTLLADRTVRIFEPAGYEVDGWWSATSASALESVSLSGPAARLPAAVSELLRELVRLRDRGPSRLDVEGARWDAARALAYRHDAAAGAARGVGALAQAGVPLDAWNGFAAALRRVDGAALQALLRGSAVGAESILLRGDAATLVPLLLGEGLTPEVLAPPAAAARAPAP